MAADPAEIPVSDGLVLAPTGTGHAYACRKCRTFIQDAASNYKTGCVRRVTDVRKVGLAPIEPRQFIDDDIEYREYFCPGCGLLLQGNFCRPGDKDLWDMQLHADRDAGRKIGSDA